ARERNKGGGETRTSERIWKRRRWAKDYGQQAWCFKKASVRFNDQVPSRARPHLQA
ncbi:unnamed protein product, partial [Amoebophrya sp. A25]